jgi:hypothetical protein
VPVVDVTVTGSGSFQRGFRMLNSGMSAGDSIMYALGSADNSYNMGQFYFYNAGSGSTSNRISVGLHSIDDLLNISATNRVGIGVTVPSYKLDVNGDMRITTGMIMTAVNSSLYAQDGALSYYGSTNGVYLNGAGTNGWLRLNGSGVENYQNCIDIYGSAGAYILFRTSNTNRMRIDSSGNVGIATDSPITKLQVGGNTFSGTNGVYANSRIGIMLNGSLTSYVYASTYNDPTYPDYGFVFMHGSNTTTYNVWSISPDGPAKGSGLNFIYGSSASNIHTGTPKLTMVGSSGNIGIGTESPSQRLHVNGYARVQGLSVNETGGTISAFIGYEKAWLGSGSSNDLMIASEGSNNIKFATNGTTAVRMMINTSGRVGINTSSPQSLLNVNLGAGDSTYGTPAIHIGGTSNYDSLTLGIKGSYDAFIATYGNDLHIYSGNWKSTATATENHNIHFYTSQNGSTNWNTPKMFLQYDGNLGVGTTSPLGKLQVFKDGGNGSGGLGEFQIVATSNSSSGSYQATIGAMNIQAGGYANLNLGDSDGVSGTRYFWHISKRLTSANELGSGARNLSYYWYDGSGFTIKFAFGTGGSFYAASDVVAYASSDIRLKEDIVKIDSALNKISQLNGYSFTWNDKQTTYAPGKKDLGVIAQEVEGIFPEIVKDRENGTKGVMYDKLVPVLIEAIKEQQIQIETQKSQNQSLLARIEALESHLLNRGI